MEKGLLEAMQKGVLAGYPVVNLKADLFDGSYHPVDSSEMAFKVAASLAYKEGLPKASPVLLEPVGKLCVWAPGGMLGDIMGAINKRRGRVLGMSPTQKKGEQMIEAEGAHASFARPHGGGFAAHDVPSVGRNAHTHLLAGTESFLRSRPAALRAEWNFSSQTAASAYRPPASRYSHATP